MTSSFIDVSGVTIDIPIYDSNRSLRKSLYNQCMGRLGGEIKASTKKHVFVRALNDISFKLEEGDRLGLIGHNGAGKSTLLSVLGGIYQPHLGSIHIAGRVTPLFNTSLGLDLDDTGYENIFTLGMFYGLTRAEIQARKDEIIAFSELGDFIHSPMRTYSNGMLLRLCFAVVTSIETDILLMDEQIGAGDATFASKAAARLESFYNQIKIMVIASHSNELIQKLCNKAMLLEHGNIVKFGPVDEVLEHYCQSYA